MKIPSIQITSRISLRIHNEPLFFSTAFTTICYNYANQNVSVIYVKTSDGIMRKFR